MNLHLRPVATDDLPLFFTFQRDPVASRMAAFGTANPDDCPLHARAAKDNAASIRVLLKCGFVVCGEGRALAEARGHEVDEFVFRLDGAAAPMPQ